MIFETSLIENALDFIRGLEAMHISYTLEVKRTKHDVVYRFTVEAKQRGEPVTSP
jgi:hypothetical protein